MTDQVPASERYKEIAALATTAAQQLRRHERERAGELGEAVAAGRQRREAADEQRKQVVEDVRKRWNAAMEALWDERWMQVKAMPEPDRSAAPSTPDASRRDVQEAFMALYKSLEKTRFAANLLSRRKKES
ncbi:hypothetical protein [Saccharopolyspora phatthalungensis]|uniref:SLT domain-containing protein n=1 Tax=Saccharopolyspora phatthalungensis TaxID=664693 RepID=A0A840Q189_9PSEU|nr:hypothetical protein [Saccharopolyspora phatthalungensis]MBB5153767.1 SLT domain-containing protein [Saccharopolyspora phatthalungensis]